MSPLLAALEFEHPLRLIWLAIAPVIVYFAICSRTSAPTWRRAASLVCRLLILTLAILAFAGLVRRGPSEQRFVVFATDVSRSVAGGGRQAAEQFIQSALQQQGGHEAAFIPFADKPGAVAAEPQLTGETLDINSSDPAAALQLAAATIPADFVPQVVLLTDGNETGGDLARAAVGVVVPVAVVPLPAFADPEVCVTDLTAPAEVAPGTDVPWEVMIQANVETTGTLELLRDGEVAARSDVALRPGENRIRLPAPLGAGVAAAVAPAATFTARLTAKQDTIAENNQRRARVVASRPLRVLLADAEPATTGSFRDLLVWQGFDVTTQPPAELAASAAALDAFDLLVLSDVSSKDLNADQMQAIDDYVRVQGGGLIVLGGERTFGEAAFRDTPLERLLPVTAVAATEEAEKTVLAMVLVIDRSQSMEEDRRLDLAKEAAKQSVRVLESYDKAGVIAFSDDAQWIANLAPVADKSDLLKRIDTLTPYGQTNMYRGVVRAVLALEQTAADRRHIILLTDGVPAPGDYREIAQRMAASGITLSTVSISKGAEQDLLKEMATIAGGRHNHCDDPSDVPRILVQETKVAAAAEGDREFRPFALRTLPGLDVASAPPLLGYARTNPKPDAEPLLFAVAGHPLLCWGRYGKGLTLAFTSDVKGPWTARWKPWPGYGAFWKRLVSHVARPPQPSPLTMAARCSGGTIAVTADLTAAAGGFVTDAKLTATVAGTRGEPSTLTLEPVAPGRYTATFTARTPIPAEYEIRVTGPESTPPLAAMQTVFVDYPEELRLPPTNDALLRRVAETTGGAFKPDPASVFAPDGRSVQRVAPWWSYLLVAALLLFVADVALRRLRF
jgi:uncharacterized membrane protein